MDIHLLIELLRRQLAVVERIEWEAYAVVVRDENGDQVAVTADREIARFIALANPVAIAELLQEIDRLGSQQPG